MSSHPSDAYDRIPSTPTLSVSDGGGHAHGVRPRQVDRTLDETLERCLLETQRQVCRLEAMVHRLAAVATHAVDAPPGAVTLMQEGNRRLQREVDEFTLDTHAVLSMVRPAAVPLSTTRIVS